MLTSEEIAEYRAYWANFTDQAIERTIIVNKGDVEIMQRKINDKRDIIKLLETILDERTP